MNFVVAMIPSIILFSIGGYMAVKEKDNWGWFIFAGLLALAPMSNAV